METKKLYEVSKNLYNLDIREIEVESRTDKFYKKVGSKYRDAIETNYSKCFESKEEAVKYLYSLIDNKIEHHKKCIAEYSDKMTKAKQIHQSI